MSKRRRHYSVDGKGHGSGRFDHVVSGRKKNKRLRPISDMKNWPSSTERSKFHVPAFLAVCSIAGMVLIAVLGVIWLARGVWSWLFEK